MAAKCTDRAGRDQGRRPWAVGPVRSTRRGELGELAEQRARVARVDDLLDEERLGGLERRLARGEALLDLGPQRGRIVGRFELRRWYAASMPPSSGRLPQLPDGHAYRYDSRDASWCAAPATPYTLRTITEHHGTVAW